MRPLQIKRNNEVLLDDVRFAGSFFKRLKGLLGEKSMQDNQGLIISPCNQVHGYFMKFPLDVVFLSEDMEIIQISTLEIGAISKRVSKAKMVLEISKGCAGKLKLEVGDKLYLV